MHTLAHICTHMQLYTYTYTHPRLDSPKADTKSSVSLPAAARVSLLPTRESAKRTPGALSREKEVKGVRAALSLARSGAGRAKGVGFLVSKEARAKVLVSAEASLRERESLFPFREQSHKSGGSPGSVSGGGVKVVWSDLSECASLAFPPSPSVNTSL